MLLVIVIFIIYFSEYYTILRIPPHYLKIYVFHEEHAILGKNIFIKKCM